MSKRADRYIAMLNKADEVYQKDYSTGEYCHEQSFKWGFQEGYEQTEKDLGWHSVDESLPSIDEEVIVLTDIIAEDSIRIGLGRICFAHIVNPELTVEVGDISYKPMSYSGWNIDGVKYWMQMPKIPNKDE